MQYSPIDKDVEHRRLTSKFILHVFKMPSNVVIIYMPLFLLFTGAAQDFVFMKTWPSGGGRAIYQMPLLVNGSDPTSADTIHNSDDMSDTGFTYNYKTRSVLWSEGKEVKSLNIDDDSITTLVDVCKYCLYIPCFYFRTFIISQI